MQGLVDYRICYFFRFLLCGRHLFQNWHGGPVKAAKHFLYISSELYLNLINSGQLQICEK